jgi:splicing factor U2AF subunit
MYVNPTSVAVAVDGQALEVDDTEAQQHFDEFYEDVWAELGNFGEIEEMHVTANLGDHLSGNLYVKFSREEEAVNALTKLQGRFYAGRPILGEFSPVTDFREARCRQYDVGECTRGGFCNFIHECKPSKDLVRDLYRSQRKKHRSRSRSRSRSPRRDRRSRTPPRRDRDRRDDRRDYRDRRDDRDRRDRDDDRGRRDDRDKDRRDDRDRRDRDDDRGRRDDRDRRDRDDDRNRQREAGAEHNAEPTSNN